MRLTVTRSTNVANLYRSPYTAVQNVLKGCLHLCAMDRTRILPTWYLQLQRALGDGHLRGCVLLRVRRGSGSNVIVADGQIPGWKFCQLGEVEFQNMRETCRIRIGNDPEATRLNGFR